MPTYALLGATGQTGTALLTVLLQSPSNKVNAYCRSKSKLLTNFPSLEDDSRVQIFSGPLTDTDLLAACCRGTHAVFMAVAAKENEPGCSIARDTAHRVVEALQQLAREQKDTEKARLPTLVQLNSATTEPRLCRNIPGFAHFLLSCAMSNVYRDLELAERYLRSHADWVDTIYFKPAAISHDVQGGHVLSTETSSSPVSFLDVAGGMIEAAERSDEYVGRAVSVLPKSQSVKIPWEAPLALLTGLMVHMFPWTYRWLKS